MIISCTVDEIASNYSTKSMGKCWEITTLRGQRWIDAILMSLAIEKSRSEQISREPEV